MINTWLNGMDSQISRVNTRIDEVRKAIIEQDWENIISNLILYNVQEPIVNHWRRQGGAQAPPNGRAKKIFFVKIEGLWTIKLGPRPPSS